MFSFFCSSLPPKSNADLHPIRFLYLTSRTLTETVRLLCEVLAKVFPGSNPGRRFEFLDQISL